MIKKIKEFTPVEKKDLAALKKTIRSCKKIAIFSHDEPDPDAIISCVLLKKIVEHFGVTAEIFYAGAISRAENLSMFQHLDEPFEKSEKKDFSDFDSLATVDCQNGMGNLSLPKDREVTITIDHHPTTSSKKAQHNIIMPQFGATATIVMHYYLSYGLSINETIANGYVYALQSETKNFSRDAIDLDMKIYKIVLNYCHLKKVSEIQSAKKSIEYYKLLCKAIQSYQLRNGIARVNLGVVKDLSYIHEITEVINQIKGILVVVVAGKKGKNGRICARSESLTINIGEIMHNAMEKLKKKTGFANGGGHAQMSAGIFHGEPQQAVTFFCSEIKKK